MKRVRYPFILAYRTLDGKGVTYAKEDFERNGFERVDDQLLATVYKNLQMFRKGFEESPTAYVKRFNKNDLRWNTVEFIYVGE